jgi:hypothetical protein
VGRLVKKKLAIGVGPSLPPVNLWSTLLFPDVLILNTVPQPPGHPLEPPPQRQTVCPSKQGLRLPMSRLQNCILALDVSGSANPDRTSTDSRVETCPPNNVIGLDNAIQIIETGELRIVIWGDNRAGPDPALDHSLMNVDVLILPVETVLTRDEVGAILRKYELDQRPSG